MATLSLKLLKSRDNYFLACKLATLVVCLPWPLTIIASLMSLAGQFQDGTPMFLRVLVRLAWLLALVYPVFFFAIVFLAEKVLARKSYPVGAVAASLPVAFAVFFILKVFVM
jgi:hypothetical protein